ncbi:MAG: IS3 family transposase [Megasphaera cerevisiae]|jgi:putative transposase|nr:IS3 family transposase [Megasphaera cerevisiae]MCI1749793.1 IS3 family transposase [Megasphaera cerevisiae]SKA09388.1 putative transposase [Megasphaera cerevisiae DSM 20462]
MSRTRRNFSAKLKSELVLELLKGEKDLNTIATENKIQPNLLRNWKKEFLDKASIVFDDSREENLKEKLAVERKEKISYAKKVGQLTMQVDWLKKNLKNCSDLTTRTNIVRNLLKTKKLSVKTGAKLLDINRTSIYYHTSPVSEEELACKDIIDHLHAGHPAWGARQISYQLKNHGYNVSRRKASRYMMEMGIGAIYPKMNLSKRQQKAKVFPYLLKSTVINRPNQAWSIDIIYIPMKHGFLYLTAVIDWYSRCIVEWEVDDTLDTRMVITALRKAFKVAKPLILNSDQGSQFTSNSYIDFIKQNHIRQSMDGKSRWADNIMIERWFRTFKYEEAYLTQYNNIKEARKAIKNYIKTYNFQRCHSAIGNIQPAKAYFPAMLLDDAAAVA